MSKKRRASYHIHSHFSDGQSKPQEYLEKAIKLGFSSLGFSCHAPIIFEKEKAISSCFFNNTIKISSSETAYNKEILKAQAGIETPIFTAPAHNPEKYVEMLQWWAMFSDDMPQYVKEIRQLPQKDMPIYLGLEIDYIPDFYGPKAQYFSQWGLDYTIGSIHFCGPATLTDAWTVDTTPERFKKGLEQFWKNDHIALARDYYGNMRKMLVNHRPDIIAHFDLIRKSGARMGLFNQDEKPYRNLVMETLEAIAESGCIMEVNTGAISRGYATVPYPDIWIVKEMKRLDIPTMVNSDAHSHHFIDAAYDIAYKMLIDAGYEGIMELGPKGWENKIISL